MSEPEQLGVMYYHYHEVVQSSVAKDSSVLYLACCPCSSIRNHNAVQIVSLDDLIRAL